MYAALDLVLVLVLLSDFFVLGSGRLGACVRASGLQGALIAVLPLLVQGRARPSLVALALAAVAIKGVVIPRLLLDAAAKVRIRREVEPYVGFAASQALCAAGTVLSVLYAGRLPLAVEHRGSFLVPTALAGLLTGFLVLTTRRKAITQVVGYLILENAIFVFGVLLLDAMPFLVEIGVLLDLVVGVFVMGIVVDHIQNEFSSLDSEQLSELRE